MTELKASDMIRSNSRPDNDYEITKILAHTAFGKVYKVLHKPTKTLRCMKVYVKDKMKKTVQNDFLSELEIIRSLDHPHTFKVFEFAENSSSFFLVTEYLAGGELFDSITKVGHFTEEKSKWIIQQILYVVNYLHTNNIVHRDLKPENIMLAEPNDLDQLKLIDFGTAKRIKPGQKLTEILGTAYYMAPEIFQKSYTEKVDVWACGVILYILICGLPPFNAKSDPEIHKKIQTEQVTFSQPEWKTVSKELRDLLGLMLEKNPDNRPTAKEVLKHPWFSIKFKLPAEVAIVKENLQQIKQFQGSNKLSRTMKFFLISQNYIENSLEELRKSFELIDTDKDGAIDLQEFTNACEKSGEHLEFQAVLKEIDVNKDGKINFSEFLVVAKKFNNEFLKTKFQEVFSMIDKDNNGVLTKEELAKFFGRPADDETIVSMIKEVDKDNDGCISFQELLTACSTKID